MAPIGIIRGLLIHMSETYSYSIPSFMDYNSALFWVGISVCMIIIYYMFFYRFNLDNYIKRETYKIDEKFLKNMEQQRKNDFVAHINYLMNLLLGQINRFKNEETKRIAFYDMAQNVRNNCTWYGLDIPDEYLPSNMIRFYEQEYTPPTYNVPSFNMLGC